MALQDAMQDETIQAKAVADCVRLMDEQVAAKGGLSGMALKAAYGVMKGIGPDYIPSALHGLLPPTLDVLDPIWAEGVMAGDPVAHMTQNSDRAAEAILGITDVRIERSTNKVVKGAYGQLRKSVKGDLAAAVPGLAKIIGDYV
jgi:hypothetical protein